MNETLDAPLDGSGVTNCTSFKMNHQHHAKLGPAMPVRRPTAATTCATSPAFIQTIQPPALFTAQTNDMPLDLSQSGSQVCRGRTKPTPLAPCTASIATTRAATSAATAPAASSKPTASVTASVAAALAAAPLAAAAEPTAAEPAAAEPAAWLD